MEVGECAKDGAISAVRHGCLFARPAGAINLKIAQQPAGLIIRSKTFGYFLPVVYKVGKSDSR